MEPAAQSRTDTGFTQSGTTAGSDISAEHTIAVSGTARSKTYRAREIIAWTTGTWVLNYTLHGVSFTDSIEVSVAGAKLPVGRGLVSIDSTTASGLDYTMVF